MERIASMKNGKEPEMSNTILFITLIVLSLFCCSAYVFILIRFTRVDTALKLLREQMYSSEKHWGKVFDVLNPSRQVSLIHYDERKVTELKARIQVTREMEEFASQDDIANALTKEIAEQLKPYIEVAISKDIVRMQTNYVARLRVLMSNKELE